MSTKRKLTEKEIDNVLDFIKPLRTLPNEIAISLQQRQIQNHKKQLLQIEIYPEKIPELKSQLHMRYLASQVEPGKSVGATASSSIGQENTQQSLSSFHTAGQNKVALITGVPRAEELLNVTRDIKTPFQEIYLLSNNTQLCDVKKIAQQIFEYRELWELLTDYEYALDRELTPEEDIWYDFYRTFYSSEFEECSSSVRLIFDKKLLFNHRKSLQQISKVIEENYSDAYCVFSPDNLGIIDVYIRTDNIGSIESIIKSLKSIQKKNKKDEEDKRDEDLQLVINDENKEYIFIRDLVIPSLLYMQINGIENIKKCYFQQDTKSNTWYITTKGSNLKEVLKHPLVDVNKTTSNHLWDIYEVLGLDAAINFLRNEFLKLLSISTRHLDLLIYAMTYNGRPQAVTRYGIDRKQVGPLAKVGFEQPFDNFFHSARVAEKEDMSGCSSAITLGILPNMGSGYVKLLSNNNDKIIVDNQILRDYMATISKPTDIQKQQKQIIQKNTLFNTKTYTENFNTNTSTTNKSFINSKLKQPLFRPKLDLQQKITNSNTVTRIIMKAKKTEPELKLLKNAPTIVFESDNGEVIERNTEIDDTSY